MKHLQIISFALIVLFLSCAQSHQYEVYVKNDTDGDLTISYKSDKHKDGAIEEKIDLKPDESKMIISTVNFHSKPPSAWTRSEDCSLVAEYVKAVDALGNDSNLEWCSERVVFQVVDIGQGEFTMTFTESDF